MGVFTSEMKKLEASWLLKESSLSGFYLVTSNENKLKEYMQYLPGLKMRKGSDLPEVDADDLTVALYKAKDNGPMTISEDTSLDVDGHDVGVNIRWLLDNLSSMEGSGATWKVLLGKNDGKVISVYEGVIEGTIVSPRGEGFGFDPYFEVKGLNKTLGELKVSSVDEKLYSARAKAALNLKKDSSILSKPINELPEWTGSYQH